ncbi:MAG: ABC transporter permease subunit [Gammaproteobacteria bacterium]
MAQKQMKFDAAARAELKRGVDQLVQAVAVTMGPVGHNVLFAKSYGGPQITKDGVTVAKEIDLPAPFENMGAKMVQQVAKKTADVAGDGTTCATVLAGAIFNGGLKYIASGANAVAIQRGINAAAIAGADAVTAMAQKCKGKGDLEKVATVSANHDAAIGRLIADGRLKSLYDRWDLGGRQQMLLLRDAAEIPAAASGGTWDLFRDTLPLLTRAAGMTVLLSCAAFPLAVLVGLAVAVGRLYGPGWLRWPLTVYVEVLRGTPLMLQLYAVFFLLPRVGLALPALVAAIAGLALNYSAYESEIYRAGLKAVPVGQFEAALSLGLSKWQALRHVLVPQAVRIVMPPVTSDFIALFKDTSVCSAITVIELTKRYSVLALSTGRIVELAVITAVLYLIMSWPLALVSRWFERRLERQPGNAT